MRNPCKPYCLKLPTCISKRYIQCPQLHHYYNKLWSDETMTPTEAWDHIREFLPNVGSVSNGAEDYLGGNSESTM